MLCRILCVMLFLAWTAEPPNDPFLYYGLWRSPLQVFGSLFVSVPGIGQSPWQLCLLALAPVCLLVPGALKRHAAPMALAIVASLASCAATAGWGWWTGGSTAYAYMQLWKFLSALLVTLMLVSVTRTSRDLGAIGTTIVATSLTRSTLAIYFYYTRIRNSGIYPAPQHLTTHEDSLLFVASLLIMLAWGMVQRRRATWSIVAVLSLYVMYAIVLNRRRLAWLELLFALLVMYAMLQRRDRKRANRFLLAATPVLLVYLAVGSHLGGPLGEPARAFKTSGSDADASSRARFEENRNLVYTLGRAGNPLMGTGWGQPYLKLTSEYANFEHWKEYLYLPHNSLLGIAVYAGLVGIFGIWLVVPMAAFLGTYGYQRTSRPVERVAALSAVALLPAYALQCFGDIGFNQLSCALMLGVALAATTTVSVRAEAERRAARRLVRQSFGPPGDGTSEVVPAGSDGGTPQ